MMEEYIIYVTDTETTGLIPGTHEIIELSSLRFCLNNSIEPEQRSWLICAKNSSTIDDAALAVNGHKREDILHHTQYGRESYIEPDRFIIEYDAWVSMDDMSVHDRVFCGQNPKFDYDHMLAMWKHYDSMDSFSFGLDYDSLILDTRQLALFIDVCLGVKRDRYGLSALVKSFGVKKEKAHRADGDVRMTKDLFVEIVKAAKPSIQETFKSKEN